MLFPNHPQRDHKNMSQQTNPSIQKNEIINNRKKQNHIRSDAEYFNSLEHYKPIFYSGQGTPVFFWNQHWFRSFSCVLFFDAIFAGCVILFVVNAVSRATYSQRDSQKSKGIMSSDNITTLIASISVLLAVNITFFLCQFLNPGLQNPDSKDYSKTTSEELNYCEHCQSYKTQNMTHCRDCKVCVWGLDHHCGFFNKCIAGWQKWAFYAFIISIFCGFLIIIVCLCFAANFQ